MLFSCTLWAQMLRICTHVPMYMYRTLLGPYTDLYWVTKYVCHLLGYIMCAIHICSIWHSACGVSLHWLIRNSKHVQTAVRRQERLSWVLDDPARPRDCFASPKAFSCWGKVFYPFREFLRSHCFFVSLMSLTMCSLNVHCLIDVLETPQTDWLATDWSPGWNCL